MNENLCENNEVVAEKSWKDASRENRSLRRRRTYQAEKVPQSVANLMVVFTDLQSVCSSVCLTDRLRKAKENGQKKFLTTAEHLAAFLGLNNASHLINDCKKFLIKEKLLIPDDK